MGWLTRLLGKKPRFESWWNITGQLLDQRRTSALMRMLTDLFVEAQEGINLNVHAALTYRADVIAIAPHPMYRCSCKMCRGQ